MSEYWNRKEFWIGFAGLLVWIGAMATVLAALCVALAFLGVEGMAGIVVILGLFAAPMLLISGSIKIYLWVMEKHL